MGKTYTGSIVEVHHNYGIISMNENGLNAKVLFYIFPDMLSQNTLQLSKEVSFKLSNKNIRDGTMKLAYSVSSKNLDDKKTFILKDSKPDYLENYNNFIYKKFYEVDNPDIIEELISQDKYIKEVTLKWILFIERTVKDYIVKISINNHISSKDIYECLKQDSQTEQINKKINNKIKRDYLFRNEFELLDIDRDVQNDQNFILKNAPLALYLEETTIDELGKILRVLVTSVFSSFISKDVHVAFLYHIHTMFLELSKIRNASAHGNPLIPLILDLTFMPSELYDLKSVFPEFNSGKDVSDWELFEPIRFYTRQLTKCGIAPMYHGGLQFTGLYTAKYLLINPARRSFFAFIFIINYLFAEFSDEYTLLSDEFYLDFINLIPLEENENQMSTKIFMQYPSSNPTTNQIASFIYFLLDPLFFSICNVLIK